MFAPPPAANLSAAEVRARLDAARSYAKSMQNNGSSINGNAPGSTSPEGRSSTASRDSSGGSMKTRRSKSKRGFTKEKRSKELHISSPVLLETLIKSSPQTRTDAGNWSPNAPKPFPNVSSPISPFQDGRNEPGTPPKRPPRPDESTLPFHDAAFYPSRPARETSLPPSPLQLEAESKRMTFENPLAEPEPAIEGAPTTGPATLPRVPVGAGPDVEQSETAEDDSVTGFSSPVDSPFEGQEERASEKGRRRESTDESGEDTLFFAHKLPRRSANRHSMAKAQHISSLFSSGRTMSDNSTQTIHSVESLSETPKLTHKTRTSSSNSSHSTSDSQDSVTRTTCSVRTYPAIRDRKPRPALLPTRLRFTDKQLPPTPGSVQNTPTELLRFPPAESARKRSNPNTRNARRVSLAHTPNSLGTQRVKRRGDESVSPTSKLSKFAETVRFPETTPPLSGISTPRAVSLRLRGGSIVTIAPPECSAWAPQVYFHGQIKLAKPTILPARTTVASLEPFQGAVEKFGETMNQQRRRSDDKVEDDVLEWIDTYGFGDTEFDGDNFLDVNVLTTPIEDEGRHFSAPLPQLDVTAVAKRAIVEDPIRIRKGLNLPPVETEEALRARGIARLARKRAAQHSREDSHTLIPADLAAQFCPPAEPMGPLIAEPYVNPEEVLVGEQGFDWDDSSSSSDSDAAPWLRLDLSRARGLHILPSRQDNKNAFVKSRRPIA